MPPRPKGPAQRSTRGVVIQTNELAKLRKKLGDMVGAMHSDTSLAEGIGAQQEASARRRISETKKSPAGKKWAAWSKGYAATRKPHHSLLVSTGALRDSITYKVRTPAEVEVGSNLVYARAHLRGNPKRKLPARPYLDTEPGFADSRDRAELREVVRDWMREKGLKK